jgi:hypothetical protein
LDVTGITSDTGGVSVEKDQRLYDITADSVDMETLESTLEELRRPQSALWRDVLSGSAHQWSSLIKGLDDLALIGEADSGLNEFISEDVQRFVSTAQEVSTWILQNIDQERVPAALYNALLNLLNLHYFASSGLRFPFVDVSSAEIEAQIYCDIALRQTRCWTTASPITLAMSVLVLLEILPSDLSPSEDMLSAFHDAAMEGLWHRSGGLYDLKDSASQLQAWGAVVVMATLPGSKRISLPGKNLGLPVSGLNLMLSGERTAAKCLEQMGENRFLAYLSSAAINEHVARGIYLEQYHLTRRFVEIITPAMTARLSDGLRGLIFNYYSEEVGHESFEREACYSVGLGESEITESYPLPLFVAYIDVLTEIAQRNPLGLLLCILVTEGFPGTKTPINDALQQSGLVRDNDAVREHEEINLDRHHTSIPRLFLSQIAAVSPRAQEEALADFTLMIEINFRAWHLLLNYYGGTSSLFPNGWLTIRQDQLSNLIYRVA